MYNSPMYCPIWQASPHHVAVDAGEIANGAGADVVTSGNQQLQGMPASDSDSPQHCSADAVYCVIIDKGPDDARQPATVDNAPQVSLLYDIRRHT